MKNIRSKKIIAATILAVSMLLTACGDDTQIAERDIFVWDTHTDAWGMQEDVLRLKASLFSKDVVDMMQSDKETFKEIIENEDWDALEDAAADYISSKTEQYGDKE